MTINNHNNVDPLSQLEGPMFRNGDLQEWRVETLFVTEQTHIETPGSILTSTPQKINTLFFRSGQF